MGFIKQHLPELIELGAYNPAERIGPSVGIKRAIARTVADLPKGLTPIIYLPGIARKELRAIELCPDELKPLAELPYRGFWWATPNNNRDWTVSGFLSNKPIGLELDIGKDEKTQTALLALLPFLREERADKLQGRRLVATDFNQLVADDSIRDLLQWMNDPSIIDSWDKTYADRTRLDKALKSFRDKGYLLLSNQEREIYQITGKIELIQEVIEFLIEHGSIRDEDDVKPPTQVGLL